ncbi:MULTISPECIES: DUF1254 domain-containing protein [Ensifer]|jgi:hypothetical protein|uniref:DUF1214 domain-containing protein n=1 Tax=Ensifer canadensis TaxID=555315 RepID=A0AAW4FLT5_9HYPH|nr:MULTISPECIES: DUF1254 domain-containing protein [Ensifer]AHK44683.1 hypothetical protein OV14_3252 [Ensifer adhaerens OV14]MDP9633664.1 hypothetical protein [Ensifer adhaerens]KQU93704.1 hypothetical protein ASD00_23815 [Ensifer sp. Root31]KQW58691.1 hypothetical protein ASD02_06840 [Ensifer sp. Root1252]KQW74396.1 hypothetical protein ASD03_07480 [Ensifer sp. Root127]
MRRLFFAAMALAAMSSAAAALSPDELARRTIERRAVEAVIWGMPAVNYDLMLQEMLTKTKGKVNEIVYWSRPLDWQNQTLTPNPDAIYLMTFTDTRDVGPVVIEVPPAEGGSINGNIVDVWQMPLEDAGPSGADQGEGGKYLVLPPGYVGTIPEGYIPLKSNTYGGYALLRSNLASHADADIEKSVAYAKRLKVYPLSQAASPPETVFTDARDVLFDSTIRYDVSFFQSLDRIVQSEPWLARDRAMIDQLRSLGIEKGKPFRPEATTTEALAVGIEEAREWLELKYDAGLKPFYDKGRWNFPADPELVKAAQASYDEPDAYPVDIRGVTYSYAYVGIKRLGAGQFYLIAIKDKDGQAFEGSKTYRLTVPANVPVEQYWSLTAYDRQTHALIRNMPHASRSSQVAELQKNADGSVDIYLGPKAPDGKESNWIPTDSQRDFELMFRLYAPTKALFEKTWVLPDVEPVRE